MRTAFALVVMFVASAPAASSAQEQPNAVRSATIGETREALVERYFSLTNRYSLALGAYEKQLKRAMSGCDGKPCQADLHRAIEETLAEIGPKFRQRMVRIYADHLTDDQLRAVIRFAETPDGRSISEAENGVTDAVADVGNELWMDANVGISRRFCAAQQEICVRSEPASSPIPSPTIDRN